MDTSSNNLNWFEIPALDLDRAKSFYENVFQIEMPTMDTGNTLMAFFPYEQGSGKAAGALAKSEIHQPSQTGSLIYLNGQPDLTDALGRVEAAGGTIVMPKTSIGPNGHIAYFLDTEGNKVAIHSMS